MLKKTIALILSTLLLCGCASNTTTQQPSSSNDSKDTSTETKTDTSTTETQKDSATTETKDNIQTDVFDSVLASLKEDGYFVQKDYVDDDFPTATIYEAERGETDYEFIIFANADAAQKAMKAIIADAQYDSDRDETVELNDDNTQLTITDREDGDTTLYVLNDNSIVKGSSRLGSESVRENMINWGFIY